MGAQRSFTWSFIDLGGIFLGRSKGENMKSREIILIMYTIYLLTSIHRLENFFKN